MRNVSANSEKREGPNHLKTPQLPPTRDFSSPALDLHPGQRAAMDKINFLTPDYGIWFQLNCRLNIPHQRFIKGKVEQQGERVQVQIV